MTVVRSRFSRPLSGFSPIGNGVQTVFEERLVDGVRKLVKTGVNPLNEFVQKSLADTQIYNILAKYERGNTDALNVSVGQFFDSSGFPKNLADAQNSIIKANRYFDSLPLDLRNKFDNSASVFLNSFFDGSMKERCPDLFSIKETIKEEGAPNE